MPRTATRINEHCFPSGLRRLLSLSENIGYALLGVRLSQPRPRGHDLNKIALVSRCQCALSEGVRTHPFYLTANNGLVLIRCSGGAQQSIYKICIWFEY